MHLPDMFITLIFAIEGLASIDSTCATSHMTTMLLLHVDGLDVAIQIREPLEELLAAIEVAGMRGTIARSSRCGLSASPTKKKTYQAVERLSTAKSSSSLIETGGEP